MNKHRLVDKMRHYLSGERTAFVSRTLTADVIPVALQDFVKRHDHARRAAREPRGARPLTYAIGRIIETKGCRNFAELRDAIEDEDLISDLFGASEEAIDISSFEIIDEESRVEFSLRSGETGTTSFKWIQNLLADHKKLG